MSGLSRDQTVELLKTGKYSDFTIKCGNKSFAVHKAIIASRSDFFRVAIDSGFRETIENEITIGEAPPLAVAMVIVYLYIFKSSKQCDLGKLWGFFCQTFLREFTDGEHDETLGFEDTINLYLLADRFMLPELRRAADKNIGWRLVTQWRMEGEDYDEDVTLEDCIEKIYTMVPSSVDLIRCLTTWILSGSEVSRLLLGQRLADAMEEEWHGRILDLAKTYDPEGVTSGKLWLQQLQYTMQAVGRWKTSCIVCPKTGQHWLYARQLEHSWSVWRRAPRRCV
ncbi:uncharacterized protein AB675_2889 [Cyphellophora attinorum]|uniref:BTB domain-containing protein n=1 Tax=Cyphellophora attinorum TaxID=1664694 RepID=A0A0N1H5Q4_9EURO|nr:uncharacterized protein AB675_2889 [Phialophora attinorum]KPI36417.1 hypothetical protein AB675_2889 [Phialophora attinorum]